MAEKPCCLTLHDSILVAYDGSKYSESALALAIEMVSACAGKLCLVHVVDANVEYMAISVGLSEKMEEEGANILAQGLKKAEEAGVKAEGVVMHDDQPYRPIVEEAKRRKASLIVMGTHGRTGLTRLLLGSVAQLVIGHAPCAVMVVPS
ncbi:universal stress protein [Thiovibrio sp. JS02]